jgi:hypothetical protein
MYAAATLFLDVCVQPDLWPDGVWPLVRTDQAQNVAALFSLAAELGIRQGGIVCRHDAAESGGSSDRPAHCQGAVAAASRPPGCGPVLPMQIVSTAAVDDGVTLDRETATYLASGCRRSPIEGASDRRAFEHLTAGVRNAVVFGAGAEFAVDRAVAALLERRIRTHAVLDAIGTADEVCAQSVVARWKRCGVDGVTVGTLTRLLTHPDAN